MAISIQQIRSPGCVAAGKRHILESLVGWGGRTRGQLSTCVYALISVPKFPQKLATLRGGGGAPFRYAKRHELTTAQVDASSKQLRHHSKLVTAITNLRRAPFRYARRHQGSATPPCRRAQLDSSSKQRPHHPLVPWSPPIGPGCIHSIVQGQRGCEEVLAEGQGIGSTRTMSLHVSDSPSCCAPWRRVGSFHLTAGAWPSMQSTLGCC